MAKKHGYFIAVYNSAGVALTDGDDTGLFVDATGALITNNSSYPNGSVAVTNSSASVANANAVATLPGVAAKTTYITEFVATASGSTAGSAVTLTVVGVISGTLNYTFTFPTGALVGVAPLVVRFQPAIPASAVNTAIVVTLPAGGVGNTNATANATGYQL